MSTASGRFVGTKVEFACPACGKLLQMSREHIGQQVLCPGCRGVARVPNPAGDPSPQAPQGQPAAQQYGTAPPQFNAPPQQPQADLNDLFGDAPRGSQFAPQTPPQSYSGGQGLPPQQPRPSQAAPPLGGLTLPREFSSSNMPATNGDGGQGGDMSPTKALFEKIVRELRKVYIGQDELILGTLVALFSSGHVLIESVPGLGKTLFVRTLGRVLGCQFGRIQFTADLMPSDITGSLIFDMKSQEFRFHPGPVFTQLLLADEINRSPAKTHAALLEIMQEYHVTVERTSHKLDRPFLVLATQNPIESEGTYNLPEAQLDRFMFKLTVDYPTGEQELQVLKVHGRQIDLEAKLKDEVLTVTSPEEIMQLTKNHAQVRIDDKLFDYINKIVRLTRKWPQFHMGASPRAGLALVQGARTLAAFYGRDYAVPDDVMQIVLPVLRHRVVLTAEADVEGHKVDDQLSELLRTIEVPRA
ncbi:MAG: AAA family ATPase [Pirellulales bacterium]